MLKFNDLEKCKNDALILKTPKKDIVLAFINKILNDECLFYIYNNGQFDNLRINKKDFEKYQVFLNHSVSRVDYKFDKEDYFKNSLLFKNDFYNIKFLGYSESINDNGDNTSLRLYFSSHGKYAELTCYDPGQMLRTDWYFISYKESESIFDFDFNPNYNYELNVAKQVITPCILTGEKMVKNGEILDCSSEREKIFLESMPEIDGYDFGSAIFVIDNDIFVSKVYFNYPDFKTISKNEFIEKCFNIEIQKEINER